MTLWKRMRTLAGVAPAHVPAGKAHARAYAVGDIHGEIELLDTMLDLIEADIAARPVAQIYLIFLGDLIDRGPDSGGVVERLRTLKLPNVRTIFLMGNHEEFLLRALRGEHGVLDNWLEYGGRECVASYGLTPERLLALEEDQALALLAEFIPDSHRDFLESMADTFRFGDYLFAHAGVRPGVALEQQVPSDLRWIREPFLTDPADHGFVVVHGHTIVEEVQERPNRIGIDTGAYRSGVLTALVIDGEERRYLATARN